MQEVDALESLQIHRDIACYRCRYNLRGLSADGRCPECGTTIAASLLEAACQGHDSAGAIRMDAESMRRVSRAATVLFCAGAIVAVVCFKPNWMSEWANKTRYVLLGALCAAFGMHLLGIWKLACPGEMSDRDRASCIALRASVLGTLLLSALLCRLLTPDTPCVCSSLVQVE